MLRKTCALCMAGVLAASTAHAASIGLTLRSDKDPLTLTPGDSITFTVGIEPASVITGYTLDIRYDMGELDFLSASQLVPYFGGAFTPPFSLDPEGTASSDAGSTGLATSDSGRASVLQVSDSVAVGDLFSLTFTAFNPVLDGAPDLTVGILSAVADDISPGLGGSAFTINPDVVQAEVAAVPEPVSLLLVASAAGLLILRRPQRA